MPWKGQPFGWNVPRPYLDYLPSPQDASMNLLHQISEQLDDGSWAADGSLDITLNYIESPSNRLAMELQFQAYNTPCKVKLKAKAVPKPDPRRSSSKFKLWKYSFKNAKPAVSAPSAEIRDAVAGLAGRLYSYEDNWQQAEQIAAGFDRRVIPEVLSVMVHPPSIRDGSPAWEWLPRVQLAAAEIATWIEIQADLQVLDGNVAAVAWGPIDWTIDAAVAALTHRARTRPHEAAEVAALFEAIVGKFPDEGYFSCIEATFQNWRLLPGLPEHVQRDLDDVLASFE